MSVALTLEVPNELYDTLAQRAAAARLTPEQWLITTLRRQLAHPARDPNLRRHFGAVNLGAPTGADNESIDADLAREYAATQEVA